MAILLLFRTALIAVALVCAGSPIAACSQTRGAPSDAEVEHFVTDLLGRMTLAEKIGQMEQVAEQPMYTTSAQADEMVRKGQVGSFLFITDPIRINKLQK